LSGLALTATAIGLTALLWIAVRAVPQRVRDRFVAFSQAMGALALKLLIGFAIIIALGVVAQLAIEWHARQKAEAAYELSQHFRLQAIASSDEDRYFALCMELGGK
jgi:hypothetical protein